MIDNRKIYTEVPIEKRNLKLLPERMAVSGVTLCVVVLILRHAFHH
jgi:hypothetical protein